MLSVCGDPRRGVSGVHPPIVFCSLLGFYELGRMVGTCGVNGVMVTTWTYSNTGVFVQQIGGGATGTLHTISCFGMASTGALPVTIISSLSTYFFCFGEVGRLLCLISFLGLFVILGGERDREWEGRRVLFSVFFLQALHTRYLLR